MKNNITYIAVERTMDPLQIVINYLLEKKGEISISNKILELMKQEHSYTMLPWENQEIYMFNRRARGTDIFFSFQVTAGEKENNVSNLEYTTDFGKSERITDSQDSKAENQICIIFAGELT